MNLNGFWRSEERTRVGELERQAYEEKKNFAGKVNKIAKVIVGIVTFEGLQPMVTEASTLRREIDQVGSRRFPSKLKNHDHRDYYLMFCSSDIINVGALEACEKRFD